MSKLFATSSLRPRRLPAVAWMVVLALALTTKISAAADVWPQFRGPAGQGHAVGPPVPLKWSEDQNVVWKSAIPGRGWSSPVVAADRIWLTSALETPLSPEQIKERVAKAPKPNNGLTFAGPVSLRLICLDRETGKILYDVELYRVETPDALHKLNSYSSPTPILDGERLYCHFGNYGTACADAKTGRVLWKKRLPVDHMFGPGASPELVGKFLIVPCDGIDVQYIAALDAETGREVWKKDRPPIGNIDPDFRKSYCTPLTIEVAGVKQVIVPCAHWFVAYNPATGEELWRINHGSGYSIVPRPVYENGLAYLCTGFGKASIWAVRVDGHGDVTQTHVAWKSDKQIPFKPSPVVTDGMLFTISDTGVANCFDAATGKIHWTRRVPGNYSASLLAADGRIYAFSQEGEVTVLRAAKKYESLAVNTLESGFMASPAALDGTLYLRTEKHLYRIEERTAVGMK